jgi:hypothetical protein
MANVCEVIMRKIIVTSFLLLLLKGSILSQVISFNKDLLLIQGNGTYEDIKDSLFIKNSGESNLVIDTIYSQKHYGYRTDIHHNTTIYSYYVYEGFNLDQIVISPKDSVKIIFYMPDLCPICSGSMLENFEDTVHIVNNSLNNDKSFIHVKGQGFTDVKDEKEFIKNIFSLEQNYPNPFNPTTKINFTTNKSGNVKLSISNVLGEEVIILLDSYKEAGTYTIDFNSKNLSTGVYFYKLTLDNYSLIKKMLFIK